MWLLQQVWFIQQRIRKSKKNFGRRSSYYFFAKSQLGITNLLLEKKLKDLEGYKNSLAMFKQNFTGLLDKVHYTCNHKANSIYKKTNPYWIETRDKCQLKRNVIKLHVLHIYSKGLCFLEFNFLKISNVF